MASVLMRSREEGHVKTETEKVIMKPQGAWSLLELEKARKGPPQNMALISRWVQSPSLQSYERINFCSYKAPSLWSFVMTALENQCNIDLHLSRTRVLCFHPITKVAPPKWLKDTDVKCLYETINAASSLLQNEDGTYNLDEQDHDAPATWAWFSSVRSHNPFSAHTYTHTHWFPGFWKSTLFPPPWLPSPLRATLQIIWETELLWKTLKREIVKVPSPSI